jgi:hypothetical protein
MAGLEPVKKSHRNAHGGYMYAGIDDIYAELLRRMASAGLICLALERSCELMARDKEGKAYTLVKAEYGFLLATKEATWTDATAKRTVYAQLTGPQTLAALCSFATKSWLRSTFQLATGDFELDSVAQEPEEALKEPPPKRKSSAEGKRDGSVKTFNSFKTIIETAQGAVELGTFWKEHTGELGAMPVRWFETLEEAYILKMRDFGVDIEPLGRENANNGN